MTRFMTPTTKQSLSRKRTFFCSAHRADTLSIRLLTFSRSRLTSARRSDRLFCRRIAPSPPPLSSWRSTRWRTFSEACLSFRSSKSISRRGAPDKNVCMRSVNVEVGYDVGISRGCPSMSKGVPMRSASKSPELKLLLELLRREKAGAGGGSSMPASVWSIEDGRGRSPKSQSRGGGLVLIVQRSLARLWVLHLARSSLGDWRR